MKKATAILIFVLCLAMTALGAPEIPEFLLTPVTNYTADYTMELAIQNPEAVTGLLQELKLPDEVAHYIDMEALCRSLLSFEETMHLQADISEDYQKMQLSLTADNTRILAFNPSLMVGVMSNSGMWLDINLTDKQNPMMNAIYKPATNHYIKLDMADMLRQAGILEGYLALLSRETMTALQEKAAALYLQYATLTQTGDTYQLHMDNASLTGYIDAVFQTAAPLVKLMGVPEVEIPSLSGWQLLGENGLTVTVTLEGGKIKAQELAADISIDLAQIYRALSGEPWELQADGRLDFAFTMTADITHIGTTQVEFPLLTEENSFSIELPQPEEMPADIQPDYPAYMVYEYCHRLETIDNQVYVPLRQTMVSAYEDTVAITYEDGHITMTSEYFTDGDVTLAIGDPQAAVGDTPYTIAPPVLLDDTTYVSSDFFTSLFGWQHFDATYDLVGGEYSYSFYTGR